MVDRPSEKYALIHDLVTADGKAFSVIYLCNVAGVSRSGYYRWLSCAPDRLQREKADYEQHLLIKEIFQKRNRKVGWRVIKMNLERQAIVMNHKKIRRLMKKYGLVTQIRRRNPYKHIAKATQEHRVVPNVLHRRFDQRLPYRAFGTDITYLYDGSGQRSYLSIIKDLASGEIVALRVSASLGVDLSLCGFWRNRPSVSAQIDRVFRLKPTTLQGRMALGAKRRWVWAFILSERSVPAPFRPSAWTRL